MMMMYLPSDIDEERVKALLSAPGPFLPHADPAAVVNRVVCMFKETRDNALAERAWVGDKMFNLP